MDQPKCQQQTKLDNRKSWRSIPVYGNLQWSWIKSANDNPKNHRNSKRHRHYKYLLAISGICISFSPTYALAETVGGVSATAAPVANSSGSVTNQAIQVLQGPYITNTYGGGIQCQGSTLNITPYITGANSWQEPYVERYWDPVYDTSDVNKDGIMDNPGKILYYSPTRTGQKSNYNLSIGVSATWSKPLDEKLQEQCKEAAQANIDLMKQTTANKRLDFEIARLKNCGELKKQGIYFHPKSPYYSVCADVVVTNPGGVIPPHKHSIPSVSGQTSVPVSPPSVRAEDLGAPLQIKTPLPSP